MKQMLKQKIHVNEPNIVKNKQEKTKIFVLFNLKDVICFLNYMFKKPVAKITNSLKLNYYIKCPRSPTNVLC